MTPNRLKSFVDSNLFQNSIMAVIGFTAILMGLETSSTLMAQYGGVFHVLNWIIQAIFLTEMALRLAAHLPRLDRFFKDGWNLFDFVIVAASLIPQVGAFATIARLARVLRLARILSLSPELRLIIATMLRSIPSLGNVTLLLGLLLYIYGIVGYHLFHKSAPQHWGNLGQSLRTLFQMLTLEGWVEIEAASTPGVPGGYVFFVTYVVIAVFVVVNLFIAVVLNNMENARAEGAIGHAAEQAPVDQDAVLAKIGEMRRQLDELEGALRKQQG